VDINISDQSETRKEVVISLTAEDVAKEEKTILKEFSQHARIPGFRPGKAPEKLLRQRYQKEIKDELQRKLLQAGYEKMNKDTGLTVLNVVDIKDPDLSQEAPHEMKLVVDIKPDFELPEYKGFSLEEDSVEVEESEIDEAIDHMRGQRADFAVVEKAAEKGDYVKCSYEGKLDGESIDELIEDFPLYRTQKNTWEEAGAGEAPGISEIATALLGMKAGDETTVEVAFGDDHEVEPLRGKTVSYSLNVEEIRERKLPELNDEFLKSIQVESVEKLREQMLESIRGQKEQNNQAKLREAVTKKLEELVDFPLPESLIEVESNQILSNHIGRQMQQGAKEEDFEQHREALLASASEQARKKVKLDLILDEIAQKEKVEVEEEDMSRYLYNLAMQTRRSPDDIVKELKKDRGRVMDIQRNIRRSKTVGKILELADIQKSTALAEAKSE